MSDTTSGGGGSGTDRLKRTAEEAQAAARERMEDVKQQTREAAGRAQERAVEEAERGKERGAGEVRRWSDALERAADELGQDSTQGALMRQAAEGLDDIARSIERRSIGEMTDAVADFGRRNPTAFLGGAMLAGFALARFATASRPRPEPSYGRDYDYESGRPRTPSAGGKAGGTVSGTAMAGERPERQSNLTSPAVGSEAGPAAASGPAGQSSPSHASTATERSGHAGGATPGGLSPSDSGQQRQGRKPPLELNEGMRRDNDDSSAGPAHGARPAPGLGEDRKEGDR